MAHQLAADVIAGSGFRVFSQVLRVQVEEYLRQRAGRPPFFAPGSLALDNWEAADYDVSTTNGPGFMGFAFGYQGSGRFYLLDWQQAASTHPEFGAAPRGQRLRAFHIPGDGQPTGALKGTVRPQARGLGPALQQGPRQQH